MLEIWKQLQPVLLDLATSVLVAAGMAAVAWLRAKRQQFAALEATQLAEAEGHRLGLTGAQKKSLAITAMDDRLGPLTRPSAKRTDTLIESSLPEARATVPPPERA